MRHIGSAETERVRRDSVPFGFTLVELLVASTIAALLLVLTAVAVQSVRQRARDLQCRQRLHEVGIAEHNFAANYGYFPTGAAHGSALFGLERLTSLLEGQPGALSCPADPRVTETRDGSLWRSYHQNDGTRFRRYPRNGFRASSNSEIVRGSVREGTTPSEITDGLSHTAAVSERLVAYSEDFRKSESDLRRDAVRYFWHTVQVFPDADTLASECERARISPVPFITTLLSRGNWGYDHILPPNAIGCANGPAVADYDPDDVIVPASSLHGSHVNVLLVDGAVRSVSNSVNLQVWRAFGTRAGGETVDLE